MNAPKQILNNGMDLGTAIELGLVRQPKRTANLHVFVPAGMRVNPDGSVDSITPAGCPPDTVGFNKNKCKQIEKKTMMKARLQQKLEQKKLEQKKRTATGLCECSTQ